jgi:myo-inositol-1(or 4)-monophosphatase
LLQAASGEIEVEREMPGDIKLAMDRRAEELIVGTILGRFPDHRVLSEECGRAGGSGEVEWVIDPLDGTSNYSRRFPCWCTCVAASRHGEPFVGVVYDPTREEMFTARRGCGACLNGLPLRVSGRRVLGESILAYGIYHHAEWSVRAWERRMPVVTPLARSTRNVGSAGLHMAYVAAGRVDAFIEYGVFPWDVAAGIVLVREAGGRVSSWNVEEGALDIVAAAPGVYDALMATGLWPAPA